MKQAITTLKETMTFTSVGKWFLRMGIFCALYSLGAYIWGINVDELGFWKLLGGWLCLACASDITTRTNFWPEWFFK
jgi:hypothetical protein